MLSKWFARVGSAIPRGFSRHYILGLLEEEPMTGKEIIDKAILQSGGRWKPSPGLIYPMLGRLLEEGLISAIGLTLSSNLDKMTEQERGKYKEFLVNELKKLQEQESKKDEIRVD